MFDAALVLTAITGRILLSTPIELSTGTQHIPVTLVPGMYIATVESASGGVGSLKFKV